MEGGKRHDGGMDATVTVSSKRGEGDGNQDHRSSEP